MSSPAVSAVEPLWLKNARKLIGVKEIIGSKDEAQILDFFKEAGHPEIHSETTPWCAAFANAMLRRAGYAGTGALNARSFLNWGTKLDTPKPGCIVVFKRGNSDWEGHVAFFLRDLGNGYLEVLGGNQGNAVSIARHAKSELLGYRWPLIAAPAVLKPKAPAKEAVKTGGAVVGGAVVVTAGKAAVDAGWGFGQWAMLFIGLFIAGGAAYAAYRWWQKRKVVEADPVLEAALVSRKAPEAETVVAADPKPDAPPAPSEAPPTVSQTISVTAKMAAPLKRKSAAKKKAVAKRKPARKRKAA